MEHERYIYVKNGSKRNNTEYYKCQESSKYLCRGSIKIVKRNNVQVIKRIKHHNHDPDQNFLSLRSFKKSLKTRSVNENTPLNILYEQEARRNPEVAAHYSWKSAESLMRLSRKRSLPNVPETLKDLADQFDAGLLHRFQACGELIYKGYVVDNSGNHSIIFSSQTLIDRCIAMDAKELHVDATFKVIPSTPKCYQLLIIHVMIDNYSIPLVYVLMEKKTAEAYDAALHYVKHNLLPEFRPTVILTDFEAALRTELIRHFPTAAAHGCWFHVNQAVWRKMKKLGFLNLINTNEAALKTLKMIMVIPLLPAHQIEEGFIEAKRYASMHNVNMLRLFNYYERYWLQNVGVEVLSVYKKKFRTNNNVESFHNKLRQMFQTSHPNIWVFLGNICKLIDNYSIKLNQTDNGLVILNTKRAKYVANDKRIKSANRQLRQGLISVGTFLKRCSYSVAGYEERMRALAIGQIYNEVVENEVPQLLDIPNAGALNHMDDEAVENQVHPERRNIFDVSDDEVVDLDQETAADMSDEAVENQVRPERRNIFDVSDDEVVDLDQETAADMSENEEDYYTPEDRDPDMIVMMEHEARQRQLDMNNIPFVRIPPVLPSLENQHQLCIICTVEERTYALIPCGHKIICEDCLNRLEPKRCPLCNDYFTGSLRIF